MLHFWKIQDTKQPKLLVVKDQVIYIGKPTQEALNQLHRSNGELSFLKTFLSIPYHYIKRIECQEGKDTLFFSFGNASEESLLIKEHHTRKAIFDFLKADIPNFEYETITPGIFSYAKPQFFALLISSLISLWALYLAVQIENGVVYEVHGRGRGLGIAGLVLLLANLGIYKLVIGYLVILGIIIMALRKRLRSRSAIEIIKRKPH